MKVMKENGKEYSQDAIGGLLEAVSDGIIIWKKVKDTFHNMALKRIHDYRER